MLEDVSKTSTTEDPQSTEVLASAGQVVIEQLYITKQGVDYDIRNFFLGLVLYEDLFSNFLSGYVEISDAASLITEIRPYGSEYITVSFRTRQSEQRIEKSFNIFAIKNRGPTATDREQAYTIHFTSGENIVNNNINISRKYSGRTDELVEKIFSENLTLPRVISGTDVRGTTGLVITGGPHRTNASFIPGFWTPSKCINWLATRSIGSKGDAPNYLFFESSKNFFFASIEDLIVSQRNQNLLLASYVYSPHGKYTIQNPTEFAYQFPEFKKQYSVVHEMTVFDMFDTMAGQDKGYYGSSVYTYDILFKEHRLLVYNHFDGYQKYVNMQDYSISGNSVMTDKSKNTRPFGPGIFNGVNSKVGHFYKQYEMYPEQRDPMYQTWVPQRNSLLNQMNQTQIHITVPGRSDAEVGKLVNFLYPKMTSDSQFTPDAQVSGIYMITAIKHAVTRQDYSMTLELTKDSVMESYS